METPSTLFIYGYDSDGIYRGKSREIPIKGACPKGWTREPLPEIPEGKFAQFNSRTWVILDSLPDIEPTPEDIQLEITNRIQALLDEKAKHYRYDNIHTACGWADKFDDAAALKAWGAACWIKAKQIEMEVIAMTRAMPTANEVMAELPEFEE